MTLYGFGGQAHIRVQSMWQTRGVWGHAPRGNFLLDIIWWNLGLFLHKQFTIYVSLKPDAVCFAGKFQQGASKSRNETKRETKRNETIICGIIRPLYKASTRAQLPRARLYLPVLLIR